MAKFTPLHDRILVRRIEEGETSLRREKSSPLAKARATMRARCSPWQ